VGLGPEENRGGFIVERDERGHWLPGRSANPGGRPGVPEVIKSTLRELSPRAVKRLGELLDSDDERIRLEAAKASSTGIWTDRQSGRTSASIVVLRTITLRRCSRRRGSRPVRARCRRHYASQSDPK
jgi:hypothetical protein